VLSKHSDRGAAVKIANMFPHELRKFWPAFIQGAAKERPDTPHIAPGTGKSFTLSLFAVLISKEGDEALGAVIAADALDKTMQVTVVAHGIDFDIKEQLALGNRQAHWRAQIGALSDKPERN
jgi:hypothetical protein